MTPDFFITALIVVLIPGTGVLYTISTGLLQGRQASIAAAFGCTLGIIPHLIASTLGLTAVLHLSSLAFTLLKWGGVAYLLVLAWSMWRDTGKIGFADSKEQLGLHKIILRGLLINILNPKLSLFFFAFLPQFMAEGPITPFAQLLQMSLVFMAMTLAVFIVYGLCADVTRTALTHSARSVQFLQKGFALVFAWLGLKLAATDP